MNKKWVIPIVLLLFLLSATPVWADMADPDSTDIEVIYINRHLMETDDFLLYAHYNIEYGTTPDNPIDETFIFRLIDTDGTTELGSTLAYPYSTSGYGEGVISFYFTAADAPTWGEAYIIRICGNPTVFATPPISNFTVDADSYTTLTDSDGNKSQLTDNIVAMAEDLGAAWTTDLLSSQDIGIVLSSQGETYFRNAIFGLQQMAPDLFFVQAIDIDYTERSWNTTQSDIYRDRFAGTWVGDSITAGAGLFNLNEQMFMSGFVLLACVGWIGFSKWKMPGAYNTHSAFLGAIIISLCCAVLGFTGGAAWGIMAFFSALYIGYILFMQKA